MTGIRQTSNLITSKVLLSTYDLTTASGTQSITGVGFKPSSCDGFGTILGSATANTVFMAHSDSNLGQSRIYYDTNLIFMNNTGFLRVADATGANTQSGVITSYDADGITITWTKTGSPTGTFRFSIRYFR